jgi:hypothetical protein
MTGSHLPSRLVIGLRTNRLAATKSREHSVAYGVATNGYDRPGVTETPDGIGLLRAVRDVLDRH